jgi:hypothetical protein
MLVDICEEALVKNSRRSGALVLVMAIGIPFAAAAQEAVPTGTSGTSKTDARERNIHAYIELLRSDLRTKKIALITEVMQFTDAEDAAFWPVYREYEYQLGRLTDDRVQLVERYAEVYNSLTDATADELIVKALNLEARRHALKEKYYATLKAAMTPRTAARVIQVENQIQLLVDLQIAASLPVTRDAEGGVR